MVDASCQVFPFEHKFKILILQDGPEYMAREAEMFNYSFPYLYDEVCPQYVLPDAVPVLSLISITFFAYFYMLLLHFAVARSC